MVSIDHKDVVMVSDHDADIFRDAVTAPAPSHLLLGELLVKENLITHAQLYEALRIQKTLDIYKPIGQILVDLGAIMATQLNLILKMHHKWARLGDVLLKTGAIVDAQLGLALEQQKITGLRLGETLIHLNYITEEQLRHALCIQYNVPFVDLEQFTLNHHLCHYINKNYAKRYIVIPLELKDDIMTLAMADPTNREVIEDIRISTGFDVQVVTSTYTALERCFSKVYGEDLLEASMQDVYNELLTGEDDDGIGLFTSLDQNYADRTVDNLVRRLITLAINSRTSDIHLETLGHGLRCRFRIDGVLQELHLGALEQALNKNRKAVISRIKVLGRLDIAEKRRPQDGSFRARMEKNGQVIGIDFRISILPGYFGENVVLRILDSRNAPASIDVLGFPEPIRVKIHQLLRRTSGILLTTGPTGSGKSTTLYGALKTLYRPEIRILTAEDPIEYVFEHFSQSEVNEKIGNTFAQYLRAFLRHDPEAIMIGEIRDAVTAQMAFRAAQTGHLVLSTLHTNDAISTVIRLRDLGIDPSLITSSLLGVISQRLVREICTACRQTYQPSIDLLNEFFNTPPHDFVWYRGKGCINCNYTGYHGRMAVAELWTPSERDIILISKGASFDEIRLSSRDSTLFMDDDLIIKLQDGSTNLEELIRVLPYTVVQQVVQKMSSQQDNAPHTNLSAFAG
jgi:type II secretory ATPase GspE/PulE/Tfp pilus assembly ATPase PilB-like protein